MDRQHNTRSSNNKGANCKLLLFHSVSTRLRSSNSWISNSSSRTFCATWFIAIRLQQLGALSAAAAAAWFTTLPPSLICRRRSRSKSWFQQSQERRRANSVLKWQQLVVTLIILRDILRVPVQPEKMSGSVCRCGQGVSSNHPYILTCIYPCMSSIHPVCGCRQGTCIKYPPLYLTPLLHSYHHFKLLCVV